jgi:chaperonin GroEL (HSP60 family)
MHAATDTTDERMAYFILCYAVEAPIRALLKNAGFNPEKTLGKIALDGAGFDVIKGQVVYMRQAGIYDAASVIKAATFSTIHSAALALTVDVLVHRRNPPNASGTT